MGIDVPVIHAIGRAGNAQVGKSAPVFDAAQEQGGSVGQQRRAGIENAMDRIRPISGGQYGIIFMTFKKFKMLIIH